MLLSLPRELRDMIIDHVLLTPHPCPLPNALDEITHNSRIPPRNIIDPRRPSAPMPPFRSNLLYTNAQLRVETQERAAKLNIPPVLDLLVHPNGDLGYTWLSRPWGNPAKWKKIPVMKVQIRTQPLSLWIFEDEPYIELESESVDFEWWDVQAPQRIAKVALETVRRTVLCLLCAEESKPQDDFDCEDWIKKKGDGVSRPVNVISHLKLEVVAAVDERGKEARIPHGASPREWHVPNDDGNNFVDHLVGWFEEFVIARESGGIEKYAILTNVGSIDACSVGKCCLSCKMNKVPRHELGAANLEVLDIHHWYLDPKLRVDIKKVRKEMGWDDGDKGNKKRLKM